VEIDGAGEIEAAEAAAEGGDAGEIDDREERCEKRWSGETLW